MATEIPIFGIPLIQKELQKTEMVQNRKGNLQ